MLSWANEYDGVVAMLKAMGIPERRQKCRELTRRYYRDVLSREEMLERNISHFLLPSTVLLDAGCGADLPLLSRYGPKVSLGIGVDLYPPTVQVNGHIRVVVGNLEELPLQSESVDVVISRSVFEHIEKPVQVFREINRVLRPKGKLIFTTPNKYYYSCLIARFTPESAKDYYFKKVFGEIPYDHFPVYYRANTEKAFRRFSAAAKFRLEKVEPIRHHPYYLMFSPLLFRMGILYDRFITALRLRWLQSNWLVVMQKE
jgi:SAM-dependent methyltransferase